MRRFGWQWVAANSLVLSFLLAPATAETRPQYGGVVHIAMREALGSLDPALGLNDQAQADSPARRDVLALIFETLVTVDARGRPHPWLAVDWQSGPGNQRWQFRLRQGVHLHDGSTLTAEIVAASLRAANPSWKVLAERESVTVEKDQGDPNLMAELALPRNSIVKRNGGGKLSGSGPFRIESWEPAKKLTLVADDNYWHGRAFLDGIEVEMGKNFHEQLVDLELGKADLIEVPPEQAHRVAMEGHSASSSQPMELVALVFAGDAQTTPEKPLRLALAHSLERDAMRIVVLQSAGQAAASLLPNWMTGYGFTFSTDANVQQARAEREPVRTPSNWTVGYDANDSVARVLVERIALNAKDAGLTLQPTTAPRADLRLVRIPLASTNPWVALANLAASVGMVMPKVNGDSIEDLYSAEQRLLAQQRVIPLFHLPTNHAVSPALRDWNPGADGSWRLADVWLARKTP
jgi:ABC-type transport system substrate-binding protein